jgi:hypothetical protein
MRTALFRAFAFGLLLLGPVGAAAQQTHEAVTSELVLRDGSRLYGIVERDSPAEVVFRTTSGALVTVARDQVVSLRAIKGSVRDGEFLPADPNDTRLFFGPTGRTLEKGQAYLGVYEFAMPFVQVGVTDRISIGGGTPLVFGFDESERPFWLTPKVMVLDKGHTQVSVGTFHVFSLEENVGIAYAVATTGSATGSFTAGVGMGYSGDGRRSVVVMAGGDRTVRRNLKFVTENYMWSSKDGVLSGGVRFFGERLSADLALAIPIGVDTFFAFPVVNFVYAF